MNHQISKRTLLKGMAASSLALSMPLFAKNQDKTKDKHQAKHQVQRLNWAGVRFENDKANLFIDPIFTDIWGGANKYPFVEQDLGDKRKYVLLTHVHGDHFDVKGLQQQLSDRDWIICDESQAVYVASRGFKVIPCKLYHPVQRSGFTVIPIPAVDGTGGQQVSWVVMVDGKKYIHCGDTVWHGKWREFAAVYGPFEAAFLPINGAIQADEPASEIPLSLTPEQAVDATVLLNSKVLVPIHYGFHAPGTYEEVEESWLKIEAIAKRRAVKVEIITPGELLVK
jgi:L-ascorbate metabolism protein UlaG (beta-lactamase superfamily)